MSKIAIRDLVIELDAQARSNVRGKGPNSDGPKVPDGPYNPNDKDLLLISHNTNSWLQACYNTPGCEPPGRQAKNTAKISVGIGFTGVP